VISIAFAAGVLLGIIAAHLHRNGIKRQLSLWFTDWRLR